MSLSDLVVDDDLDIAVDADTYQDQTNPAPPLPGNYRMIVVGKIEQRKDKNGAPVFTDGKFPVLTIQRAKIVEPVESEKEFGLFADLRTKPFDRFGTVVSDIGDITRSLDQTRSWKGLAEGLATLEELTAQNTPFTVQGKWEAYDAAYVEQAFAEAGVTKANAKEILTKDALNAIYKKARLGTNDFKPNGKGGRHHVATGPSGAQLEARFKISKFIPSLEQTALGPYKVK